MGFNCSVNENTSLCIGKHNCVYLKPVEINWGGWQAHISPLGAVHVKSGKDLISAVSEEVRFCTTRRSVKSQVHPTWLLALMLGEERCRSRQCRFWVGLAALWSIGRGTRQVNISTEHLIGCLGILSDGSRHVEYSGVSGILYWLFFMCGQDFYAVTLCFSARPATPKVGKTVSEAN